MKKITLLFLFFIQVANAQDYYVATNGNSGNTGTSTGSPWSLAHAEDKINDGTVPFGSTVHVKAGAYGDTRLIFTRGGSEASPIKIKGYTTTPNDINTTTASTYNYNDPINANTLPTIENSGNGSSGNGIWLRDSYITLENFQIIGYKENVNSYEVSGLHIKNVVSLEAGVQEDGTSGGRGIITRGFNNVIENCFDLNSTAQGITLQNSSFSTVRNNKVYNDNLINPGGYFILISASSYNNLVEGCTIYRDKNATIHGGHGFIIKDVAENNIVRNSIAYNTGIEVNFSGVKFNTFENISLICTDSEVVNPNNCIRIGSGASDNIFRNIYMEDVRFAIEFRNNNDGPAATPPSTNADSGGNNNLFENIIVNQAKRLIHTSNYVNGITTTTTGNKFHNITAYNITLDDFMTAFHTDMTGTEFKNILIDNSPATRFAWVSNSNFSLNISNSNFSNVAFSTPSGTNITTHNPLFVNAVAGDFNLQASSNLIDTGIAISGLNVDFNNNPRVVGSGIDVGAIEYQGGAAADTTPPVITGVTESVISENSIQVEFSFNEGSTGRIEFGTTTEYGTLTNLESNFLTFHRQNINGLTAGTQYFYRVLGEDAAGNTLIGAQRTATTLGTGANPDPTPAPTIMDLRAKFLKSKKIF